MDDLHTKSSSAQVARLIRARNKSTTDAPFIRIEVLNEDDDEDEDEDEDGMEEVQKNRAKLEENGTNNKNMKKEGTDAGRRQKRLALADRMREELFAMEMMSTMEAAVGHAGAGTGKTVTSDGVAKKSMTSNSNGNDMIEALMKLPERIV